MPGGVNSPVRAFRAVGGTPLYFAKAKGAILTDADGKAYVDYVSSWGAIILGHAHPAVTEAVTKAAEGGTSYGAPHAGERGCPRTPQDELPQAEPGPIIDGLRGVLPRPVRTCPVAPARPRSGVVVRPR